MNEIALIVPNIELASAVEALESCSQATEW